MKEYWITDLMAQDNINRAIKRYGLEGTEQVIKKVYRRLPKVRNLMLKEYNKKLRVK